MSKISPSKKAKLVISFFLHDKRMIDAIAKDLENLFGSIDMVSRWILFNQTTYYEKEMSAPLYRRVFVFKDLVEQFDLAEFKLMTNDLENRYTKSGKRLINIDPGYILAERFVLATGKNYAHRICIGLGIYADLTLVYIGGEFQVLPWTYPDYAERYLRNFLLLVRDKYLLDLKRMDY